MQNNAPLITIGMPIYNGDKFLNQALESLSKQTFTDYEILISDNASIDKTADIIKEWQAKNPKIKYFRQEENIGALKNFEWLLNNSKSNWFMFAAYDDLWSENYLSELYKKIKENNEDVLLSAPKVIKTKENGEFDIEREFDKRINTAEGLTRIKLLLRWVQSGWFYGLYNKQALTEAFNYANYKFKLTWGSDFIVLLPILLSGKVTGNNNAVFYQRQTGISDQKYRPKTFKTQYELYKKFLSHSFNILSSSSYNKWQKINLIMPIFKYTDKHACKIRRLICSILKL